MASAGRLMASSAAPPSTVASSAPPVSGVPVSAAGVPVSTTSLSSAVASRAPASACCAVASGRALPVSDVPGVTGSSEHAGVKTVSSAVAVAAKSESRVRTREP
jgi:hypothetical protein